MSEVQEAELVQPSNQAVVVRQEQAVAPSGLFGTQDPTAIIERATAVATALKAVIVKQGLVSRISGKEYPKCEAWTLLGTMLSVFPVLCWTKPVEGGWEARVEARTKSGEVVGAAEAECLRSERNWSNRDDFALRSMAQTRATAKCLRMPLGFVMTLSGFEATPAEEMVSDHPTKAPQTTPPPARKAPQAPPRPSTAPVPFPTAEKRAKMIQELKAGPGEEDRQIVTEYFQKLTDPTPLAPFEQVEELKLIFVPGNREQMNALIAKVRDFKNSLPPVFAFPPHQEPGEGRLPDPAPSPKAPSQAQDPEWWRPVIIPVPHKNQKRDDYMKHPDTIGALFDLRHEDENARKRLFGFAYDWQPKPREFKGKTYEPSAADLKCRDALDSFVEWFEKNHPEERNRQ